MLRAHSWLFLLLTANMLCSCDVDLFGSDTKKIGRNYRLVKVDWPGEFEFGAPGRAPREAVMEIGWQKPLILVRGGREESWKVIDTVSKETVIIADEQRRTQPRYSSIPIYSAAEAWKLPRKKRRW
jgi:hypothetical protein